jgi:Fe2+ transport system protein FeoA
MSGDTLNNIPLHQERIIHSIEANGLSPKLTEMGLYPGKKVKVLYRAPFGDPIAVELEGYVLSLRLTEASFVKLENQH